MPLVRYVQNIFKKHVDKSFVQSCSKIWKHVTVEEPLWEVVTKLSHVWESRTKTSNFELTWKQREYRYHLGPDICECDVDTTSKKPGWGTVDGREEVKISQMLAQK